MSLLTTEDKKNLLLASKILRVQGYTEAMLFINYEDYHFNSDKSSFFDNFDNLYRHNDPRSEVPDNVKPILQKIIEHSMDIMVPSDAENDEFALAWNTKDKTIGVSQQWTELVDSDSTGRTWDLEEIQDENQKQRLLNLFQSLENDVDTDDDFLRVTFDGSGDSGWIENKFVEGPDVPSDVEDFCYGELESNFGGWEINEGSFGEFTFDLKNKIIEFSFTAREDQSFSRDLFYENFAN